jgi:hypothetical protein
MSIYVAKIADCVCASCVFLIETLTQQDMLPQNQDYISNAICI